MTSTYEQRLAAAPALLSNRDIHELTGASMQTIRQFWPKDPTYPPASPVVGPRNTKLRDRDAFDAWYRATILNNPKRRGNASARADQPQRVGPGKHTLTQIAKRLNVSVEAVRYWVRTAKDTDDPFPAGEGGDGRGGAERDGEEVDAWLRRNRREQ